ncbi:hypothetical protein D9M69_666570 [compost metagenome]
MLWRSCHTAHRKGIQQYRCDTGCLLHGCFNSRNHSMYGRKSLYPKQLYGLNSTRLTVLGQVIAHQVCNHYILRTFLLVRYQCYFQFFVLFRCSPPAYRSLHRLCDKRIALFIQKTLGAAAHQPVFILPVQAGERCRILLI